MPDGHDQPTLDRPVRVNGAFVLIALTLAVLIGAVLVIGAGGFEITEP